MIFPFLLPLSRKKHYSLTIFTFSLMLMNYHGKSLMWAIFLPALFPFHFLFKQQCLQFLEMLKKMLQGSTGCYLELSSSLSGHQTDWISTAQRDVKELKFTSENERFKVCFRKQFWLLAARCRQAACYVMEKKKHVCSLLFTLFFCLRVPNLCCKSLCRV